MAGEHYGIIYQKPSGKPRIKLLSGHFGISFSISGLKPVNVVDSNGRGLFGVRVTAKNVTFGDRTAVTDRFGNTSLFIEDSTTVIVQKDSIVREILFTEGPILKVTIDLPIIPS